MVFTRPDMTRMAEDMDASWNGGVPIFAPLSVPPEGSATESVLVSFDAPMPGRETLDALAELDRGGLKEYDNVRELFQDLDASEC